MGMKSAGSFLRDTWATLRGKPASFPPSSHTHPWSDITGKPTQFATDWSLIANVPASFPSTWATVSGKPSTFPPSAHTHVKADITDFPATWAWTALTGVPASFPPSAHTHVKADITDFPTTWAWASLTGVPATFPPSAHVHAIADVTGLQAALDAINAKKTLQLVGTYSVGETALITLGLTVRRYPLTIAGLTTADRLVVSINGVPQNGSLQDVFVSAANTVSVGALIPILSIAATVAIPIAIYKIV